MTNTNLQNMTADELEACWHKLEHSLNVARAEGDEQLRKAMWAKMAEVKAEWDSRQ